MGKGWNRNRGWNNGWGANRKNRNGSWDLIWVSHSTIEIGRRGLSGPTERLASQARSQVAETGETGTHPKDERETLDNSNPNPSFNKEIP